MHGRRIIAWAVALLAACALIAGLYHRAAEPPEAMKPDDFARTARQLASDALEGARLAEALATGLLTRRYAVGQVHELAKDVDDAKKDLEAPSPHGDARSVERMRALADRVRQDLEATPARMADREALGAVAASQRSTAAAIAQLGAGA